MLELGIMSHFQDIFELTSKSQIVQLFWYDFITCIFSTPKIQFYFKKKTST